eukprot:GHVH01006887.1.p2 GENE.GHVH01006887.1~~GHVH01006887.1.p2  ORF type:complete len:275 (+),score=34.17 GHVH01006887.1:63-887(+)
MMNSSSKSSSSRSYSTYPSSHGAATEIRLSPTCTTISESPDGVEVSLGRPSSSAAAGVLSDRSNDSSVDELDSASTARQVDLHSSSNSQWPGEEAVVSTSEGGPFCVTLSPGHTNSPPRSITLSSSSDFGNAAVETNVQLERDCSSSREDSTNRCRQDAFKLQKSMSRYASTNTLLNPLYSLNRCLNPDRETTNPSVEVKPSEGSLNSSEDPLFKTEIFQSSVEGGPPSEDRVRSEDPEAVVLFPSAPHITHNLIKSDNDIPICPTVIGMARVA